MEKSRWQKEYEALPEWARSLVDGMRKFEGYGSCACHAASAIRSSSKTVNFVASGDNEDVFSGLSGAIELAAALSAPWPPPPPPLREKRAFNIAELMTDDEDDGGFDQPCAFGNRVSGHAVYCHNEGWPNSPRKCRRDRKDFRHEDCPGFVANPDCNAPAGSNDAET